MKIRLTKRVVAATLLSASAVAAVDGCSTARKVSAPQPAGSAAAEAPTKEYQWQDMSTGGSFFGKPKPTPQ